MASLDGFFERLKESSTLAADARTPLFIIINSRVCVQIRKLVRNARSTLPYISRVLQPKVSGFTG